MSYQKFDSKTTNRLISQYKETISKYTEDNCALSTKLADLKTTLNLNQTLLVDYITSTIGESDEVTEKLVQIKQIWEENEQLIKEKNQLELKTSKLQEIIEDTPTEIREEIALVNNKNSKMKQLLIKKDGAIKKLKLELEKLRKNALFKNARIEIYVTDPTKINVEINSELISTKTMLEKATLMHTDAKSRADKLQKEVKTLQNELDVLKNSHRDSPTKVEINNKGKNGKRNNDKCPQEKNGRGKSSSNKAVVIPKLSIGHIDQTVKTLINEEYKVSSASSNDDKSDSYNENDLNKKIRHKAKTKQKELDILEDEYNSLKKQNDDYEKKIKRYRIVYKEMKEKINNLLGLMKQHNNKNEMTKMPPSTEDAT